ncbi:alpha-E domain-containing protein, partial [Streptomyces niveiscabiei]
MLSRIADSLYWLQRYMERTDGMLRLLKTSYILSFDKVQAGGMSWQPALEIFTS